MVLKLEKRITRNVHEGNIAWQPQTRPRQCFPWKWALTWAIVSCNRVRTAPRLGLFVFRSRPMAHCTRAWRQRLPPVGSIYRPGGMMEDLGLNRRLVRMLLLGRL